MIVNDILSNRLARLAIAYGRHAVGGNVTKHRINAAASPAQVHMQVALGQASQWDPISQTFFGGGWHECEHLFYAGYEIQPENYHFHSGGPADAPDAFFPEDIPHPKASYITALVPEGPAADLVSSNAAPTEQFGVFKCLEVADYNEDGDLIDVGYSPQPARHIADLMLRSRRKLVTINWPAWVTYRDFCAELISWDDGALTPHFIELSASAGGSLAPGTYWVRVATKKDADISSASKDRSDDGIHTASVVISGGNLQFTVEWASQLERGATGYRVYVGTSEGGQDKFFEVNDGATNTLLISTLAGASNGVPPEVATGALLRQIPRFESHLFFPPPFDLAAALDRIAQITCMDWHYSGGKLVFLTPEVREPVFTLNMAELNSFKTYRTDRRQQPNQIIVNFRDLDHPDLKQADPPVTVNRDELQRREGVRPFVINGGCMYRSQAQRVAHYWARRLIDSAQMLECVGSPRTYIVLPGDTVNVSHDVPGWEDVGFYIEEKEESEDTRAGYPLVGRIAGAWYSDTDDGPLPSPLPAPNASPFEAPPVVEDVDLEEAGVILTNGIPYTVIRGGVQFAPFVTRQIGRVWVWRPGAAGYEATQTTLTPAPSTLEAAFELPVVAVGEYKIKVVTESEFGVSLPFGDHPEFTVDVTGDLVRPLAVTDVLIAEDASQDSLIQFELNPRPGELPAEAAVEIYDAGFVNLKRSLPVTEGTSHAALLRLKAGVFDEEGLGYKKSNYANKNTLLGGLGATIEPIVRTNTRIDFGIHWAGADGDAAPGSTGPQVWLYATANPFNPLHAGVLGTPLFGVRWETGSIPGMVKEVYLKGFPQVSGNNSIGGEDPVPEVVLEYPNADPGFGALRIQDTDPEDAGRRGPRYTFMLAGTEQRIYRNYQAGMNQPPICVIPSGSAGFAFPFFLVGQASGSYRIYNVIIGGPSYSTIYSKREKLVDFGSVPANIYVRIYQKSRYYPTIQHGIPVDVIAPPP